MSFVEQVLDWAADNIQVLAVLASFSALLFIVTLFGLPLLVIKLREDFFLRIFERSDEKNGHGYAAFSGRYRHPLVILPLLLLKNLLGVLFVCTGFLLLFMPGQGLLTILAGLLLLNFPGKRRLELAIVSKPSIRAGLQWIRRKAGKKPFLLP